MLEYPRKMMGALLIAGYEKDERNDRQLDAARRLLRPDMKCVIVHSCVDEFSRPSTHGFHWARLMKKQVAQNLMIVTEHTDTDVDLAEFQEGLNFKTADHRKEFGEIYRWLFCLD